MKSAPRWGFICVAVLLISLLAACGENQAPVTIEGESGEATEEVAAVELGASRNTTRLGGADAAEDAAAVALAANPRFQDGPDVEAAVVVPDEDWRAGIAAAVLAGEPLRAPILVGDGSATEGALSALDPKGAGAGDAALYAIGDVTAPGGYATEEIDADGPAALAAEVDELRQRLTDADPEHILVVSIEEPAFAMPAVAWAARSGDPVLFVERDSVPDATKEALERHPASPVYLLGPDTVISEEAQRELERISPGTLRVAGDDPVSNAIAFARYADATFGWNINDPGHGLVLLNIDRPLDAAAAAPLSASGKWGAVLLTNDAGELPGDLRDYLLDIKPGYREDPTRAVYNHVYVIGDESAISFGVQAEVDQLAELTRIGGSNIGITGPVVGPTGPEREPEPRQPKKPRDR